MRKIRRHLLEIKCGAAIIKNNSTDEMAVSETKGILRQIIQLFVLIKQEEQALYEFHIQEGRNP